MTGVSRRNLSQAVTDELLRLLRDGEIREGERLPTERGLMEMFQVGRNTVREAVHALAAQGILDVRPGRGATVRGVSSAQTLDDAVISALLNDQAISDLYDFRRIIEVDAAGRAAERATEPDTTQIGVQLDAYLHAYHERMPTWVEDVEFHKSIARASHNVIYVTVLEVVNDKLVAARRETQRSTWCFGACFERAPCDFRGHQSPRHCGCPDGYGNPHRFGLLGARDCPQAGPAKGRRAPDAADRA